MGCFGRETCRQFVILKSKVWWSNDLLLLSSTYPHFGSHEFIVTFLIIYLPYLPVLMCIVQYS